MSYGIKMELEIKTTDGKKFTHLELQRIISDAIWKCPEFRNVIILSFEDDGED